MTAEEKEELKKYKDYPETSSLRRGYDRYFLPFDDYVKKYYSNPDLEQWTRWNLRYVEPAFDKSRHTEMIKNFGYVSITMFDFNSQYDVYDQLKNDERLPEDVKKFIGFLAGAEFFSKYNLTAKQWFNLKNWHNPNVENEDGKTINEILSFEKGLNYFKVLLTQMPFWNR